MTKLPLKCYVLFAMMAVLQVTPVHAGKQDDCDKNRKENYVFYRTLALTGDGSAILNATRGQFKNEWGSCIDLDKYGAKMVDFYESYGFNVRQIRQDPYKFYSTDEYQLLPLIYDNDYRIVTSSIFDFSQFTNSPVHVAAWELLLKKPLKNSKYDIPAKSYIFFGAYRIKLHQRDFCLKFHTRSFVGPAPPNFLPLDNDVYSDEWGPGSDRGLITIRQPYQLGYRIQNLITFPPEKPRKT